jgi:LPS-assembly lipoprotein
MSLYKTLLALPLLAACGFAPVYGPQGAGTALQGRVLVEAPDTRDDQLMLQQIERRLGRAGDPAYGLAIDLIVTQEGLAIDADGDIDRYNLLGTATYTLTSSANSAVVSTGTVTNFTGYSSTGSTVATLAAERDARQRLMTALGDMVVDRLVATKL